MKIQLQDKIARLIFFYEFLAQFRGLSNAMYEKYKQRASGVNREEGGKGRERERKRDRKIADERHNIKIRVFIPRFVLLSSISDFILLPSMTLQPQKQTRIFIRIL